MNRYACYFADNQGCIVLNATDDEQAAWIALHWARMRGAELLNVEPIEDYNA